MANKPRVRIDTDYEIDFVPKTQVRKAIEQAGHEVSEDFEKYRGRVLSVTFQLNSLPEQMFRGFEDSKYSSRAGMASVLDTVIDEVPAGATGEKTCVFIKADTELFEHMQSNSIIDTSLPEKMDRISEVLSGIRKR